VSAARFSRLRSPSKAAMRSYWKVACGVLLLGWFCLGSSLVAAQSHDADVAIVVHPDTPVSNLPLAEVRKVFLGERQYWNANTPVVLLIRAPVARERNVVLKTIYQMSESQFKQYWIAKIFRAEAATAPKVVYSNDMANELAAAIPGAIAFIDVREVRPGTKVIRVDGHLPGEPGYPLR
jgi:ABC-type phosphate transport system substrate-binding protein